LAWGREIHRDHRQMEGHVGQVVAVSGT